MATVPQPENGKILRWKKDGSGDLENVTIADLLLDVAAPGQPAAAQAVWLDTSALFQAMGEQVAEVIPISEAAAHRMAMQEGRAETPAVGEAGTSQQAQTSAGAASNPVAEAGAAAFGAREAGAEAAGITDASADTIHQPAMDETGKTEAIPITDAGTSQQAQTEARTEAIPITGTGTDAYADGSPPVAGTFTVPDTTGTSITGINPGTCTDNVGIVKWKIVEGASDPGTSDPGQSGATSISSTTSWAPGATLSFTSSATSTGTRHFRLHLWDAAGNHGVSADATATITIGSSPASVVGVGAAATTANGLGLMYHFPNGVQAGDLCLFVGVGFEAVPAGWTALIAPPAPDQPQVAYWVATGSKSSSDYVTIDSYNGGKSYYDANARILVLRGAASFSSHGQSAFTTQANSASWTGGALTSVEAHALLLYVIFTNVVGDHHATAVGGGVDTMLSHSGNANPGVDFGYKTDVSGNLSAPTATLNSASSGWQVTLAVLGG